MTNPEKEMGKNTKNPEATKVSDEEYQWLKVLALVVLEL